MRKKISIGEWFSYFKMNFVIDYAIEVGLFVAGFLIALFVFGKGNAEKMFPLGVSLALVSVAITVVFTSVMMFSQQFNVAVAMGCTRKNFLGAYLGTTTVFMVVELLTAYLMYYFERLVYAAAFPTKGFVDAPEIFFKPGVIVFCLIAAVIIKFFSGELVLHFGKTGFIVLWLSYMGLCFGMSNLCTNASREPDGLCARILDTLIWLVQSFYGLGAYILGYAVLIILFGVFGAMQLRQEVRSA